MSKITLKLPWYNISKTQHHHNLFSGVCKRNTLVTTSPAATFACIIFLQKIQSSSGYSVSLNPFNIKKLLFCYSNFRVVASANLPK